MTLLHMIIGPAFFVMLMAGAFFASGFLLGWQVREDTMQSAEQQYPPDEHTASGS